MRPDPDRILLVLLVLVGIPVWLAFVFVAAVIVWAGWPV